MTINAQHTHTHFGDLYYTNQTYTLAYNTIHTQCYIHTQTHTYTLPRQAVKPVHQAGTLCRANSPGNRTGAPQEGCTCFMDGVGT